MSRSRKRRLPPLRPARRRCRASEPARRSCSRRRKRPSSTGRAFRLRRATCCNSCSRTAPRSRSTAFWAAGSRTSTASLTANGRVWIINPNGVMFGAGATVNVAGLIATTADIGDQDFLAGNYAFGIASSNPNASVINAGKIRRKKAGAVVLAAPHVANEGIIEAKLGSGRARRRQHLRGRFPRRQAVALRDRGAGDAEHRKTPTAIPSRRWSRIAGPSARPAARFC